MSIAWWHRFSAPTGCAAMSSIGVDVRAGGWDIRGRWFGVVVGALPPLARIRPDRHDIRLEREQILDRRSIAHLPRPREAQVRGADLLTRNNSRSHPPKHGSDPSTEEARRVLKIAARTVDTRRRGGVSVCLARPSPLGGSHLTQ